MQLVQMQSSHQDKAAHEAGSSEIWNCMTKAGIPNAGVDGAFCHLVSVLQREKCNASTSSKRKNKWIPCENGKKKILLCDMDKKMYVHHNIVFYISFCYYKLYLYTYRPFPKNNIFEKFMCFHDSIQKAKPSQILVSGPTNKTISRFDPKTLR